MKKLLFLLIALLTINSAEAQFFKEIYKDFLKYGTVYAAGDISNAYENSRKDYFIEYRSRPENKKRQAKITKLWYFENKHKKEFKEKREIYRVENLDRDRITRKNWRRKNSERLNLKEKEKCETDINHKLRKRIRNEKTCKTKYSYLKRHQERGQTN